MCSILRIVGLDSSYTGIFLEDVCVNLLAQKEEIGSTNFFLMCGLSE
jgi:hypothetical protein